VQTLATVEKENGKRAAGATAKPSEAELHGKIVEFLWWMKKQGYRETTINGKGKRLTRLVRLGANLFDPESVKEVLATQNWFDSGKETTAYAYDLFAKYVGIKWERPTYKPPKKLPFIPIEREIDDLIAGNNSKSVATFLQIAKETGARAGEIYNLKWTDIDFERKTLMITPEKGSDPRIFKLSSKLSSMLENLPKTSQKVFSNYKSLKTLSLAFQKNRKRLAYKLGNPRLLRISFHTLRHWKATVEYHKTKDILHVMQMLGHRNIKNTLIYTQLIQHDGDDEYVCKVAKTVEQASELIEAGFDYVCEIDGVKLFRKRK
jgi:integrase